MLRKKITQHSCLLYFSFKPYVGCYLIFCSVITDIRSEREFRAIISSNGDVNYNYPVISESRCTVNVRRFPFDTQICDFTFGSWSYDGLELDIKPRSNVGDLSTNVENVEWTINHFNATRNVDLYNCCPEPYPSIQFSLEMERKPLFYVINMLLPSLLLTLMSTLTFVIPSEAGEKVSFVMTLILSLAVFQLMIADSVPPSAETLPLICKFNNYGKIVLINQLKRFC